MPLAPHPFHTTKTRIEAVLGPTNTGKTHLAVERLLKHSSGMIGVPLRLLARELYDRIVVRAGEGQVALITGEEKRLPPDPRYFVCTVESMPTDRPVDFLAVDEVQLAQHDERGHIFTDRILHARGVRETLFLGSDTIAELLRALVPEIAIHRRARLSTLRYEGSHKLHQLPRRSAVIAFSARDVYATAERIKQRHGGAAVVLGALSPRARNAQIALYQAQEVQHIVATDAIGMGLNMDVDHVAFLSIRKFDGAMYRDLRSDELAQIAGRAGRFRRDGSFGVMPPLAPLSERTVEAIEKHAFPALRLLQYRNSALDFSSVDSLRASLTLHSKEHFLKLQQRADDQRAFEELLEDATIRRALDHEEGVRLLWNVCGIPDFRGRLGADHVRLLGAIFNLLRGPQQCIPTAWMADRIHRIDRSEGDIETLLDRLAAIRTWTYISHRDDWIHGAQAWQERTRTIEDRLSDALHRGLTQRFVDRRASVLLSRPLRENLELELAEDGEIRVAGELLGRIEGLHFRPAQGMGKAACRAMQARLAGPLEERVGRMIDAPDEEFRIDSNGWIFWQEAAVGRLDRGPEWLTPRALPVNGDLLDGGGRNRLRRRLQALVGGHVDAILAPLTRHASDPLKPPARGLVYRLRAQLGFLPRSEAEDLLAAIDREDRRNLARLDVRVGTRTVYVASFLRPASMRARASLWAIGTGRASTPEPPAGAPPALPRGALAPAGLARALGYVGVNTLWIRADLLERVLAHLRKHARSGPFVLPRVLLSWLACREEELLGALQRLDYALGDDALLRYRRQRSGSRSRR